MLSRMAIRSKKSIDNLRRMTNKRNGDCGGSNGVESSIEGGEDVKCSQMKIKSG